MPEDLLNENTALGMLRAEHNRIDEMIQTCRGNRQVDFVRDVKTPLLKELAVHGELERQLFFPFIENYVEEAQFAQAVEKNAALERLSAELQSVDPQDPQFRHLMDSMSYDFDQHCFFEEQFAFLALEMNTSDMHNRLVELGSALTDARDRLLKERH